MTFSHLEHVLQMQVDKRINVYYVCGADLAYNQMLYKGGHTMPIICVGRPQYTDKLRIAIEDRQQNTPNLDVIGKPLRLIEFELDDISSTLIRNKLAEGDSIDDICPNGVSEYLTNNNLISK